MTTVPSEAAPKEARMIEPRGDQGVEKPAGRPRDAEPTPEQPPADAGGLVSSKPTMPGPSGAAETTERVGDPDASSEASGAEAGAAAGAVVGVAAAGPVGAAVAVPVGAAIGAIGERLDDDTPEPPAKPIKPGWSGTGPTDPIYDVARIQRRMDERAGRR
jgi:hypothetical protein